MTKTERQRCERLARALQAACGSPLIVPPRLYRRLLADGVDVTHVRANQPIPSSAWA